MRYSVSELSDIIRDRRTIPPKDYTDRVVHRDLIERVLGNGTWAPNHGLTQPWRFHVFTGVARQRLADFMGAEYTREVPATQTGERHAAPLAEQRGHRPGHDP
jgi:nitroreductase